MNLKKVLITGSSGQSGMAIAKLQQSDYEIIGIDQIEGPFTSQIGSITDFSFVDEIMDGIDFVIHTASLHAPHVVTKSREEFIDTNIKGTLNLLESAAKYGVQKFVYTSTTSVYGVSMENESEAVWITEELPPKPRDIYDITKIAAENLCRDFFSKKLKTMVLRVSRFWDEPMEDKLFYRMYRGLDVRDVAIAHKLAIESELEEFHVFNISSQTIFSQEDLKELKINSIQLLKNKIPDLLKYYEDRKWKLPTSIDRVYVIEKARELLGYEPKYNIEELLRDLNK